MTQNPTSQTLPSEDAARKQSAAQDDLRTLQEDTPDTNKTVQESTRPQYPNWPTSKPGPRSTLPPPGMRSINVMRSEQVKELGYNQETGEPGVQSPQRSLPDASMEGRTSFDQLETAQESLKKRKERL
ncbi:MAG TPA: hypothetical protein VII61_06315 [Ktedonobacteraceae bacterium]|jgi:hypothetical protein